MGGCQREVSEAGDGGDIEIKRSLFYLLGAFPKNSLMSTLRTNRDGTLHAFSRCQESTSAIVKSKSSRSNGFSMCISFRLSILRVTSSDETLLMRMAGIRSSPRVACR